RMKISVRQLLVVGGVLLVVALAVLALWSWPARPTAPAPGAVAAAPRRTVPPPLSMSAAEAPLVGADNPAAQSADEILTRLGIDPKATTNCAQINVWNARGASLVTITENMKDGGMLFDEGELACLTASPVPPGVLDVADAHEKRPVPPGASNGPMP